jgi:predicted signal transduction protein with EAL and GGDEF domain
VRDSDTVSRRGGDEFVILLSELAHASDAGITAYKVLATLRAPHQIDDHCLYVTASIGIATYPDDGVEAETLLRNADTAMYHAKEVGRDNYQFFKPMVQRHVLQRQSLENALRDAVEQQQFTLAYQPQINLLSGMLEGLEALLRWQHPQLGQLASAHFIRLAEERHFIVPIGRWVLREACARARSWQDCGHPSMRIAINISAAELRSANFAEEVFAVLVETGLQPESLELEIAEAALMEDSGSTLAVLRRLRNYGVQLALDNFGTGYSSLSHLMRFPICTLKVDRSLLVGVNEHSEEAGLVRALIGLARNLHLRVIAAGVENEQQHEFLRQQHCTSGQGFHFGAPLSSLETATMLRAGQVPLSPASRAERSLGREKYM